MQRVMRRGEFLAIVGAAAGTGSISAQANASAHPAQPKCGAGACPSVRVRLFGTAITRVDLVCPSGLTIADGTESFSGMSASFDSNAPDSALIDNRSQPLDGPVTVLTANAQVVAAAYGAAGLIARRAYSGSLILAFGSGPSLSIVNVIDVESYVASTLASEVSPSWHPESLMAQAIVSRTYGMAARARSVKHDFDVTDDTASQVYRGADGIAAAFIAAAAATAGHVIWDGAKLAQVFYSATCGGHTAAAVELTGRPGPPYLAGVSDADAGGRPYCARATYFQWKNVIPSDAVARVVGIAPASFLDIAVTERWPDTRVKTVTISRADGEAMTLDGHAFYRMAAASLGYKVLPSTMFELHRDGESFEVNGRGLGHGVGMCQWGARGRADAGMSATEIVQAYFPGTQLRPSPA